MMVRSQIFTVRREDGRNKDQDIAVKRPIDIAVITFIDIADIDIVSLLSNIAEIDVIRLIDITVIRLIDDADISVIRSFWQFGIALILFFLRFIDIAVVRLIEIDDIAVTSLTDIADSAVIRQLKKTSLAHGDQWWDGTKLTMASVDMLQCWSITVSPHHVQFTKMQHNKNK